MTLTPPIDLSAIFLNSASEATTPVTSDSMSNLCAFMGLPALPADHALQLAEKVDAVRAAFEAAGDD